MKIDLMALAQKADETYIDVECSFDTVRIHHVPDAILLAGISAYSEPDPPTVLMKTATGTQERPAKKGEKVYDEWHEEVLAIREKQFELRQAKSLVLSLRDVIDWSQYDISQPPPHQLAQDFYNGSWPENEYLRKKIWLDYSVLIKRDDREKIYEAINTMNRMYEPTDEMVEEVKKNSVSSLEPGPAE